LPQIILDGSIFYDGISSQSVEIVQYLLEIGFSPNSDIFFDDDFDSEEKPLTLACGYGNLKIVKLLVESGASFKSEHGTEAIEAAINGGNKNVFEYLLTIPEFNLPSEIEIAHFRRYLKQIIDTKEGRPRIPQEVLQLCEAAAIGDLETVKALVESGVELNAVENLSGGHSPLSYAAERKHTEVAKYLLSVGADPNFNYPLMAALGSGASEIAYILLKAGADINQREDCHGETVLMFATSCYIDYLDLELIQLLIQRGADVNARDYNGLSVVDHVKHVGNGQHIRLMNLLKEAGASD
jgi:ankyrin repeat protein